MTEAVGPILETIEIARPIDRVWRTLVEAAPDWLGCMRYRAEVGHTFYMQPDRAKAERDDIDDATHCQILTLDPPHLFRFSWFMPGMPSTFVSFRLEPIDANATRVRFVHEGWEQFPPEDIRAIRDMLAGGWTSFVLPGLKQVAER